MNNIQILDCTLRDGGYCNNWEFGFNNIKKIIKGLLNANIEIIECGFISNKGFYNPNISRFNRLDEIKEVIPIDKKGKLFVAMMNYGEFDINSLPVYDGSSIDGIRVAFHKRDCFDALDWCKKIKEKGYLVFIQPMVSLNYMDYEFINLLIEVNKINPYAFYIVDSFGMMKEKDLTRLFYLIENNLNSNIMVGFHCHNNMQLAYSNAQRLTLLQTNRNIIIDTSVYGMGRGAGNLNTELFIEYLNDNYEKKYFLSPILNIIDEIIDDFYQQNYWGYSLPNYISAVYNAHPNYARYLDDKKTLTINDMNDIFTMIDEEKKVQFDKDYIEELYIKFMESEKVQDHHKTKINQILKGKEVVLIAPGKSSVDEANSIINFIKDNNVVVISINYAYDYIKPDYVFLSNLRRYRELNLGHNYKFIVTSNIPIKGAYLQINYRDLLNEEEMVRDNAGLMAIKFLIIQGVASIYLAGFDGYSHDTDENYGRTEMAFITRNEILDKINLGMEKVLKSFSESARIHFLTEPKRFNI